MEAPAVFLNVTICILLFVTVCTSEEVCDTESFHAQCNTDEAIFTHKAWYGRMSLGRCIEEEDGYHACSVNSLPEIDQYCSGKQNCTLLVSSNLTREALRVTSQFTTGNPCDEDLLSYLDVEYSCVPAIQEPSCSVENNITQQQGILSSDVMNRTGCGSEESPLLIKVFPGQRINMTLQIFGWTFGYTYDDDRKWHQCNVNVYLSEPGFTSSFTGCESYQSYTNPSSSKSNTLQMSVVYPRDRPLEKNLFVKYTVFAIGCADITAPLHTSLKRNGDTIVIECEWTRETWLITCHGNSWVGEIGNCSSGGAKDSTSSAVASIDLLVGLAVLVVGLLCVM